MAKLLSQEEVLRISAKMAAEYGLPPPIILEEESYYGGGNWTIKVEIFRVLKIKDQKAILPFKKKKFLKIRDFWASDYEEILTRLEAELSKFDKRVETAERYREKYAMQEADEMLNEMLQKQHSNNR